MPREDGRPNPETLERPHFNVINGGKEGTETPMEELRLEHHLLTCSEKDLQLFKEYLTTYQKTDALFDLMSKTKGDEKIQLKQEWNNAKERLADARIILPKELRTLLEELPGFGRKQTMRGLEFLATDITTRRGSLLHEVVARQADVDKARVRKIRQTIRRGSGTAQRRTHTIPHVEDDVKPATQRAGWFKRNARRVALALLPFIGGGAVGTTISQREEAATPQKIADVMKGEEELPMMPLKSRLEIPENEAEIFESKIPPRVVTREKIRKAVERKTARELHEEELRSTGTVLGMTPEEEEKFATPLAERMQRRTETFEPLDISAGTAQDGGRSRDLYENLQAMDPTGAGTHVGLSPEEIKVAAQRTRDTAIADDGEKSAPHASRE